jgi:hypothetical protein
MSRGRGRVQTKIMEILALPGSECLMLRWLAFDVFGNEDRVAVESTRQALRSLIARGDVIERVRGSNGEKYYESTAPKKGRGKRKRIDIGGADLAGAISERDALNDSKRRLARMLGMLGVDSDAEALSAARAIDREFRATGRTWQSLLNVVGKG